MNKNDAKEKQQQAKPKTQEDKRSKKGLYKDFENVFDEKWEEKYKDTTDNPARKRANNIYIVSCIILLLAILVSIFLRNILLEFILCIILLVGVVIVYFIDRKKFALEYESMDERKMRCAEETINEFLGGGAIDVQKIFKNILASDRYHQRIVKQYRQYLIDNYLGISK